MKISIFLIKFLFIGALFIVSNENLYLSDSADLATFNSMFLDWMGNIFSQVGQITGYVFNSEWLPDNPNPVLPLG